MMKDQLLFDLEDQYFDYIAGYGIKRNQSRFTTSFRCFKEALSSDEYKESKTIPQALIGEFRQAIFDLTELFDIFQAIKGTTDDDILRDKLIKLNSGNSVHSLENATNSVARNTQFEMILYSELKESGVNAIFAEPNPDILINSTNHNFAIECKRVFSQSPSRVQSAVGDARDQLKRLFERDDKAVGIIAIDLSRHLTNGELMIESDTDNADHVRDFLGSEMERLRASFSRHWAKSRIGDQRIVCVIVHATILARLQKINLLTHAGFSLVQDIHGTPYSNLLFDDAVRNVLAPLNKLASK
jgi:hypothetical protein